MVAIITRIITERSLDYYELSFMGNCFKGERILFKLNRLIYYF